MSFEFLEPQPNLDLMRYRLVAHTTRIVAPVTMESGKGPGIVEVPYSGIAAMESE